MRWWVVREDGEGEGDGEIVAWAKWVVPHEIGEEERKSGEIGGWPEGANVELCEEFFGKLREGRRRWVGEEEYCEFLFLCSRGLCHSLFELFSTTLQVDGWVTIFLSTPLVGATHYCRVVHCSLSRRFMFVIYQVDLFKFLWPSTVPHISNQPFSHLQNHNLTSV